jgi:glycosyltransferase involved in cell wall biosynthesis
MRIALLSPLPPEQTGIADYASHFIGALEARGIEVLRPLQAAAAPAAGTPDYRALIERCDWRQVDLVHAELGGGRVREFECLQALQQVAPALPLTATVHDPERLIWRPARLPGWLDRARHLPRGAYQAATLLADPITLRHERQLARHLRRLVTLTHTGAQSLRTRMQLPPQRVSVVPHGNLNITPQPLPALDPLKLLYFGFIHRGKGLEDLIDALALAVRRRPPLRRRLRLTLAGGTAPAMAFGGDDDYLAQLQAQLRARGIVDMVSVHTDIAAERIAQLVQAHHALVLPYRESRKLAWLGHMRGTSGALSWAAACGRGVITSDARAFPEEVAHGNGAVYPQGDVAQLAHLFERLAEQPAQAAEWARAARALGQRRLWPSVAAQFHRLFVNTLTGATDAT